MSSPQPPPPQAQQEAVQLKRSLGLWNGVAINVGVIVGSGIFVSSRGVLEEAGSVGAALVVWSGCGLLALLGALCFAELGTAVRSSGGEYTYIKLTYGPLASFLYIWVLAVVTIPCSNAIAALTFANYVLQPIYRECEPPEAAIRLVALGVLMLLVYVNCASVDQSIKFQSASTLAKVLALLLIVGFGLERVLTGSSRAFSPTSSESLWANTSTSLPHLARAFYAGFYTYSGWNSFNNVTEEIKNPRKNLPRAIIISIGLITLLYILTNVAYFAVLTKPQILSGDAIVVLFGQITMPKLAWLMPLAVALSTVSGLNASIFAASRIFFVGSRQGQLFSTLQMINVNSLTPIPSLLFLGAVSALYLFTTKIIQLINYTVFVESTFAALAVSTVLVLRVKKPELERPLKISLLIPVIYLLFSVLLLVLPLWSAPSETSVGIMILLAGVPVYYATAHWSPKPKLYQSTLDGFNETMQKLTLSLVPDKSDGQQE